MYLQILIQISKYKREPIKIKLERKIRNENRLLDRRSRWNSNCTVVQPERGCSGCQDTLIKS